MKKLLLLAALVAVAFMPVTAQAAPFYPQTGDPVKFLGTNGGTTGGGEFRFDVVGEGNAAGQTDFVSFCIERGETISAGGTYYVKLSEAAVGGGGGAEDGKDDLNPFTAYLYHSFVMGTLAGTSGAYDGSVADQNALQLALWRLEQEVNSTYDGWGPNARADEFYSAAITSGWTDIGNVRVAQLWTGYNPATGQFTGNAQDVLTIVPDGGATLSLLGAALLGLGALRRKLN